MLKEKVINKSLHFLSKNISAFSPFFRGRLTLNGLNKNAGKFDSCDQLVNSHFTKYSDVNHVCKSTLMAALNGLGEKSSIIVETGSSAWGTNSSLLFDSYVNSFGGKFETVDIRVDPSLNLYRHCCNRTFLSCDDSVSFLKKWSAVNVNVKIDLLYLDSWDLDLYNSVPSALHGLAEFLAVSNNLQSGSLLLIDDTPHDLVYFKKVLGEDYGGPRFSDNKISW